MKRPNIHIGDTLTCGETGKTFTALSDGFTTNYATDAHGNIYSDEGVDIRERRELLDRTRPFYAYISGDGKHLVGWKGNVLGDVVYHTTGCSGFVHSMHFYRIRDIHGGEWYGRNGGSGMCIILRAKKS